MIDPETKRIAGVLVGVFALVVLPALLQWLLKLGGSPQKQGNATIYRIKPMMRLISWAVVAGGVGLTYQAWLSWAGEPSAAVIELALAIACFILAMLVPSEVILNQEGIYYHRLLCRDAFVSWQDLDHVEKQKRHNSKTMTDSIVYFYRGKSGASVPVDDMGLNAEDVLQNVREHRKCPEQPYKKR